MAFRLPAKTNPLRALFDLDLLVKIESRELVVTLFEARGSARRTFESDIRVQSVAFVIVEANGMVSLIAFERNREHGGTPVHKILWNFGKAWETVKI